MTIPLIKESEEFIRRWRHLIEKCHFCEMETRYWHENTNNPVCPDCAKKHKVSELPDHGQWIRQRKRREAAR